MKKVLALLFLSLGMVFLGLWITDRANAEMRSITVAASVVSVDGKQVTVKVDQKTVQVPRKMINERDLKKGDAILITFRGKQIEYLLGVDSDLRSPASAESKKP